MWDRQYSMEIFTYIFSHIQCEHGNIQDYYVDYCHSHWTLLWIWIMLCKWYGREKSFLYHKQNVIYQNITFMINNDFFFELWTCTIGAHTKLVSKWKVFQIFPSAWEHEIFLGLLHGVGLGVALGYIYITIFPFPIFDANTCWRWSHFHYIIILLYIPFFVCCLIIYIFSDKEKLRGQWINQGQFYKALNFKPYFSTTPPPPSRQLDDDFFWSNSCLRYVHRLHTLNSKTKIYKRKME